MYSVNGENMKYCQYCGVQLYDDAKFCCSCGKATIQPSTSSAQYKKENNDSGSFELLNKLSSRLQINAIIWFSIAVVQILFGLLKNWSLLIVGVFNIISAVTDIKNSKLILTKKTDIISIFEPITMIIITLIYNLVYGGIIGILGSIYYLIFVRGFVMENKENFLTLVNEDTIQKHQTIPEIKDEVHINIDLTEEEISNETEKKVTIKGLEKPLNITFPKTIKDGNVIKVRKVKFIDKNGKEIKKDVYIKVNIKRKY